MEYVTKQFHCGAENTHNYTIQQGYLKALYKTFIYGLCRSTGDV